MVGIGGRFESNSFIEDNYYRFDFVKNNCNCRSEPDNKRVITVQGVDVEEKAMAKAGDDERKVKLMAQREIDWVMID
ncbi:unnamed protein product [Haemonchus placei]|uniref:Oxidoreductase n=1 Tax=Haemonchus placei TaxID=6290 RepID=A0A0N4WJL3_HAEPC|nr:unnamed protein product [Haemonchus placei]